MKPQTGNLLDNKYYAQEHLEIAATERTLDLGYMRSCLQSITIGIFFIRLQGSFINGTCGLRRIGTVFVVFSIVLFIIGYVGRRCGLKARCVKLQDQLVTEEQNQQDIQKLAEQEENGQEIMNQGQSINVQVAADGVEEIELQDFGKRQSRLFNTDLDIIEDQYPVTQHASKQELLKMLEETLVQQNQTEIVDGLNVNYTIPIPPMENSFPKKYFKWRSKLTRPPTSNVYETAGGEVSLIFIVVLAMYGSVLGFQWSCY